MKRILRSIFLLIVAVILIGYLIPEKKAMPCGSPYDYDNNGFWTWRGDHPHCGVDIFAKAGTPIESQTGGIVLSARYGGNKQGNSVTVLGPKWRIHNYYHLKDIDAKFGQIIKPGTQIGTVGNTGNAASTPSHVHYELATLIPYVWRYFDNTGSSNVPSKVMKMFYLNPADHIPSR